MRILSSLVVMSTLLSIAIAEQCGSQAGGALCDGGLCCSQWGYCGSTDDFCGAGCQSQCSEEPTPTPPTPTPTGQCGSQGGGALCSEGLCCGQWGYCGTGDAYCGAGCQSQCPAPTPPPPPPAPTPPTPPSPLEPLIDSALFDELLLHRNNIGCERPGFYTYYAFITAANYFPSFGTSGDLDTRKREIAAFLAQTSHETTGGWGDAPDGPYAWGYCYITEQGDPPAYCAPSTIWPCAQGKKYFGRGPIQISYNYNYGQAGEALKEDLLNDPDKVANDAVLSFKTALWFWMTPQAPKPSCHDVMTGQYEPTATDVAANRLPGFGYTTNIINGGLECGFGPYDRQQSRIGFYERYCGVFGVNPGDNIDCNTQRPFGLLRLGSHDM